MKNLAALDRALTDAGFTLVRMTNHKIWRCPCGHAKVATSTSRHGGRGDQNARALMARTLRVCAENKRKAA